MNSNNATTRKAGQQVAFQGIVMRAFGLRPAFREVFLLCDIQGFTIAETAYMLAISPAIVTKRLHRARRDVTAMRKIECQPRNCTLVEAADEPGRSAGEAHSLQDEGERHDVFGCVGGTIKK
jgi:hypothetical protein